MTGVYSTGKSNRGNKWKRTEKLHGILLAFGDSLASQINHFNKCLFDKLECLSGLHVVVTAAFGDVIFLVFFFADEFTQSKNGFTLRVNIDVLIPCKSVERNLKQKSPSYNWKCFGIKASDWSTWIITYRFRVWCVQRTVPLCPSSWCHRIPRIQFFPIANNSK